MTVGAYCKPSLKDSNPKSALFVTKGYFSFGYPLVTATRSTWNGASGMPHPARCLPVTKSLRISLRVRGVGKELPLIVRAGKSFSQKVNREISGK